LTTADFNGDGKPDLAVTNYTAGSGVVSVMLGNGDGTFGARLPLTTDAKSRDVVAADVNHDGKLDLVVSNYGGNSVSVLLGNGNGTFGAQATFATDLRPRGLAVADMNRDGKLDVVTSNGIGTVSVLLGNGDGTLATSKTFAASSNPYWVAVGDVNGDGRPDVVVANQADNNIGVMLGDVPPVVVSIVAQSPATQPTSASTLVFGVTFSEPVTGVDATDFAVAVSGTATTTPPVVVSGSGANYTVTVSGVSGNGTVGLNLVDNGSIQNAAGNPLQMSAAMSFVLSTQQTFSGATKPYSSTLADLNGDGKLDLVTTNANTVAAVSVALGNGNGTFGTLRNVGSKAFPRAVAVADVNRDGKPDLIVAGTGNTISVLAGNGDGTFKAQVTYAVSNAPYAIAVADLNGDGILDVATADNFGGTASVLLGNGNGTFGAEKTFSVGVTPNGIAATDLNGDGKMDLVVTNGNDHSVSVLMGNGDGTFVPQVTYDAGGTYASTLAVGDVNGDGKMDVVVVNNNFSSAGSLRVMLGNGDGTLAPQQTIADAQAPTDLVLSDLNNDGKLDIITSNNPSSGDTTFGVFLGNGDGTFGARQAIFSPPASRSVSVGDLNNDGLNDVVVANSTSPGLVAGYLLDGSGSFTGATFNVAPHLGIASDTITGTAGADTITLKKDTDGQSIDWTISGDSNTYFMSINDVNGLTINGNGGADIINLDYTNGNPLPHGIHLNGGTGKFTINNLQGATPLAGTTVDINRSTVFINYASPANEAATVALIKSYLANGYNGGAWNGTNASGVMTSAAAAANTNHNTAIGWADSGDGSGVNTTANTVELKYTLNGDTNLNGTVDIFDLNNLLPHFNAPGVWTGGDFTYNGTVDIFDLNTLLPNFNTSLGSQVQSATTSGSTAAVNSSSVTTATLNASSSATAEAVNAAGSPVSNDASGGGIVPSDSLGQDLKPKKSGKGFRWR
jgi:hypothetical protein